MTTLSAADTIRAAIARLERIHVGLGAEWNVERHGVTWTDPDGADEYTVFTADTPEVVTAIVTLHRTIDAQLAILRSGLDWGYDMDGGHTPDEPSSGYVIVDLARAILGPRDE